jgi:uncharacterized protein YbdZ (MbtH family)
MDPQRPEQKLYRVIKKPTGEYAVVADTEPLPPGGRELGRRGSQKQCMDWLSELWVVRTTVADKNRDSS